MLANNKKINRGLGIPKISSGKSEVKTIVKARVRINAYLTRVKISLGRSFIVTSL
jgi:hypothetical protein